MFPSEQVIAVNRGVIEQRIDLVLARVKAAMMQQIARGLPLADELAELNAEIEDPEFKRLNRMSPGYGQEVAVSLMALLGRKIMKEK